VRRVWLVVWLVAMLIPTSASAIGRQHHGATGYVLHNSLDGAEEQKVVVYGNQSDFSLDTQAVFNFETDEGPCDAARVYVSTVLLFHRNDSGDNWSIISRTDPGVWKGVGGNTCASSDEFVSSPFVGYRCGQFQAEAIFRVDWGSPHDNITGFLTRDSVVFQLCG
jgi:hypothetical protein